MRQIDVHKIADEARFNGFHGLVLFWCALIIIFDGYDLAVAGIALPSIMKEMGVDYTYLCDPDEVLRVSKAVSTAADTWISQSNAPARRLPKQPTPATPKAKAGPQLLQNSSSRCPSCRETAPVRTSSPAVWAPTG